MRGVIAAMPWPAKMRDTLENQARTSARTTVSSGIMRVRAVARMMKLVVITRRWTTSDHSMKGVKEIASAAAPPASDVPMLISARPRMSRRWRITAVGPMAKGSSRIDSVRTSRMPATEGAPMACA